MAEREPNLPGLYELVALGRVDSSRARAERLAAAGAEEGTLVWAGSQSEGTGRHGRYWMSGNRNLHCSIILRPDDDLDVCCQLSLLASVCTAMAISRQAEPLQELRYRWPNDVVLNRGKVAGVTLSGRVSRQTVEWMVVTVNVNVYDHPESRGLDAASMRGEGFQTYDRVSLLEAYSREFLYWIDRWSEEGAAPVIREWLFRGHQQGEPLSVVVGGDTVRGTFEGLGDSGELILTVDNGRRELALSDFFIEDFTG